MDIKASFVNGIGSVADVATRFTFFAAQPLFSSGDDFAPKALDCFELCELDEVYFGDVLLSELVPRLPELEERAVATAAGGAIATAKRAAEPVVGGDTITVLSTVGPLLTKVWSANGISSYGDAASFKIHEVECADIHALSALLFELETNPKRCIVRGRFKGKSVAQLKGNVPGTWVRQKENFEERPLHMCLVDVDGFTPFAADPVQEPEAAILEYIQDILPACFHGRSFHWQLSSSAGAPGKAHLLKAHLWFWLETPYTSLVMRQWAISVGHQVDSAVFRTVQVHYTAAPIFEDGVADPVPKRSGFRQGEAGDTVPLVIDPAAVAEIQMRETASVELVDPTEKPGWIGPFHRAYTMEEILEEFLADVFEFEGSDDRRLNFLQGGGAPGGAFITDCRQYIVNTHNTDPLHGRATNKWDLVRHYHFGDRDEGADELELLDMSTTPSHLAMIEMVEKLDKVVTLVHEERHAELHGFLDRLQAAADADAVARTICPEIRKSETLTILEREQLATAVQRRIKDLTNGTKLPIGEVRKMVAKERITDETGNKPDWADNWVWVAAEDCFMHMPTRQLESERSLNARHDRDMRAFMDENGNVPTASKMCLQQWNVACVDRAIYMPGQSETFEMSGYTYVNSFRPDLLPAIPDQSTNEHRATIVAIETHLEILIPNERERSLVLDFLAFTAQNMGQKVRWAVLLKGVPGDGKSFLGTLMRCVLGVANVRDLNSSTLESSSFTGWAGKNCFVVVEELKLHGHNRYDVFNRLKPYISNSTVEINPKGVDPFDAPNPMNFLLLTNFEDAIPLDQDDRRVMVVRSPFHTKQEFLATIKERTGLSQREYWERLHEKGIYQHAGAVRRWLLERELSPEFNPNGDAPITAARNVMVELSRDDAELAARDAIEEEALGVYRELVSLTHLADVIRERSPATQLQTKRASTIMTALGFQLCDRVRWGSDRCRIYTLHGKHAGLSGQALSRELDRLEAEREERARAAALAADFDD